MVGEGAEGLEGGCVRNRERAIHTKSEKECGRGRRGGTLPPRFVLTLASNLSLSLSLSRARSLSLALFLYLCVCVCVDNLCMYV